MVDAKKMESESERRAGVITTAQAAALLKCTPQWIRQLEKQGYFRRLGRDQYQLVAVVQGYVDFKNSEERRSSKTAADARVRDARAREYELKNAERERKLVQFDEHIAIVDEMAGMVRSEFAGLPARVTRDLQLRRTIEQAVNDILDRLADLAVARARKLGPAGAAAPALTAADAGSVGG
ncbi:hypothetical protein PQJ75_00740 [Rhodoplanes sp. TEM]|uniref:AbiEi antitoxin N-terminal domain-containing protein n=1 Tax=Rhodoplanes tepidamans TaxID=200616 RepID=A0ABT5J566_RHOTP|nr:MULTISPECIES: type IV toxin-antitoxin system AbiEi family antitoxin domain-containing protein [Rhodoplanes]MDC7784779.1 hypothetical protein [Rhodoplanes tepidamans]MDC7982246.1 hypothetical protein [Rhodoplanes sp. TEM]MDQ0356253.1 phage terminase Nu1 subunit (DNA packaging protein) [Rhodoplanes tepidamans]